MNKLIELDIALKFANIEYDKNLESSVYDTIDSGLETSKYDKNMLYWQKVCKKIEIEIESIIRTNYPQ